ncbi:MAG: adaptor protein MecA [Firmicutes bacterium]|nr:adaptor protein MecA [Bacillota bacterium]
MKIIRVEQDRIKVVLSESELIDMNIDIENLSPNSPELSGFLRIVMDEVRRETGFSLENGQVMVEASTYKDGIILMLYKTKMRDKNKIKGVKVAGKKDSTVFEFCSFDDLSTMLLNTEKRYILSMRLYRHKGNFYIAIPKNCIPFLMYEFSLKPRKSSVSESVLSEYGHFLADGNKLMIMTDGLKKIV